MHFFELLFKKNDAKKNSVIKSWGEVVKDEFEIQHFREKSKKKSGFY